jgi:hypothetical protein
MDRKALLSTLWIFVLFNIIFRDLHEVISPGFLEEAITGYVDGMQITERLVFIGAIIVEIPIAMVLLSRVLKYRVNRWVNIIAAAITIMVVFSSVPTVPADIFFDAIEVVALSLIIWYAWKWPKQDE